MDIQLIKTDLLSSPADQDIMTNSIKSHQTLDSTDTGLDSKSPEFKSIFDNFDLHEPTFPGFPEQSSDFDISIRKIYESSELIDEIQKSSFEKDKSLFDEFDINDFSSHPQTNESKNNNSNKLAIDSSTETFSSCCEIDTTPPVLAENLSEENDDAELELDLDDLSPEKNRNFVKEIEMDYKNSLQNFETFEASDHPPKPLAKAPILQNSRREESFIYRSAVAKTDPDLLRPNFKSSPDSMIFSNNHRIISLPTPNLGTMRAMKSQRTKNYNTNNFQEQTRTHNNNYKSNNHFNFNQHNYQHNFINNDNGHQINFSNCQLSNYNNSVIRNNIYQPIHQYVVRNTIQNININYPIVGSIPNNTHNYSCSSSSCRPVNLKQIHVHQGSRKNQSTSKKSKRSSQNEKKFIRIPQLVNLNALNSNSPVPHCQNLAIRSKNSSSNSSTGRAAATLLAKKPAFSNRCSLEPIKINCFQSQDMISLNSNKNFLEYPNFMSSLNQSQINDKSAAPDRSTKKEIQDGLLLASNFPISSNQLKILRKSAIKRPKTVYIIYRESYYKFLKSFVQERQHFANEMDGSNRLFYHQPQHQKIVMSDDDPLIGQKTKNISKSVTKEVNRISSNLWKHMNENVKKHYNNLSNELKNLYDRKIFALSRLNDLSVEDQNDEDSNAQETNCSKKKSEKSLPKTPKHSKLEENLTIHEPEIQEIFNEKYENIVNNFFNRWKINDPQNLLSFVDSYHNQTKNWYVKGGFDYMCDCLSMVYGKIDTKTCRVTPVTSVTPLQVIAGNHNQFGDQMCHQDHHYQGNVIMGVSRKRSFGE